MADQDIYGCAETGTYTTTGPAVNLGGTVPWIFGDCQVFGDALSDTQTAMIRITDQVGNWAIYAAAEYSTGTPNTFDLSGATLRDSVGTLSNSAVVTVIGLAPEAPNLSALEGAQIGAFRNVVSTSVSGSLTSASHSGGMLVTSGNVTIPNGAGDVGFSCVLIAGGAHTVTFNSTTSAAMAAGDIMTVLVESTTAIHAVLTEAANKVAFS